MRSFKIGVITDSLKLPLHEGIRTAKTLGAEGIQFYANTQDVSPDTLNAAGIRELKTFIADQGLTLSAVCGDIGNFMDATKNPGLIARSKRIVDLARDLGTDVVTTHIGSVPDDSTSPLYKTLQDAARELGSYASENGMSFAIETGPETAKSLRAFLDSLEVKGIGANLDPANLVMVCRDDPVAAVHTLAPYIVHTHAKDGRNLKPCDPAEVYAAFVDGNYPDLEKVLGGAPFVELPLGEGDVDWDAYLDALTAIGYKGYLTIEREEGNDRVGDVAKGIAFLQSKIN